MFVELKSEYLNDQLNDALNFLKESINTFQSSETVTSDYFEASNSFDHTVDDQLLLSNQSNKFKDHFHKIYDNIKTDSLLKNSQQNNSLITYLKKCCQIFCFGTHHPSNNQKAFGP